MKKYEFYYHPRCIFCIKVLRKIKDRDDIVFKNIGENEKYHRELVERGGKEQVPCLMIDGEAMYESDAILAYFKNH